MRKFTELPCDECPSNCNKENGIFKYESYKKGEVIPFSNLRSHLLFILTGQLKISTNGKEIEKCKSKNVILLVERNRYTVEVVENCELLSLAFIRAFQTCDVVRLEELKQHYGGHKYRFHTLPMNKEMQAFVKSTIGYLRNDVHCVYIHNAKQIELFVVCRYFYTVEEITLFFHPVIDREACFETLVKANHAEAKNVEELAKLCGYNFHTFKKLFQKYFDESPYQWMLQQSAKQIGTLLMDHSVPIKAIVADFGFSNQSHLNLFCKRRWGGTAKQIRTGMTAKTAK